MEVFGGADAKRREWAPAHNPKSYIPRNVGPGPSYGAFVRAAEDVVLENWDVRVAASDARPAFVFDGVERCRVTAAVPGGSSPHDVGLRNGAAVDVSEKLRVFDEGAFETPKRVAVPKRSGLALPAYTVEQNELSRAAKERRDAARASKNARGAVT